jgi:hypothetical protein
MACDLNERTAMLPVAVSRRIRNSAWQKSDPTEVAALSGMKYTYCVGHRSAWVKRRSGDLQVFTALAPLVPLGSPDGKEEMANGDDDLTLL